MTAAHPIARTGIAGEDFESGVSGGLERLISTGRDLMMDVAASGYATVRFSPQNGQQAHIGFGSLDRTMRATLMTIGGEAHQHMETSLLPFRWWDATSVIDMSPPFLARLPSQDAVVSGIGFPTRLGIMGNGFVAFFGRDLRLDANRLFEIHRRSYRLMRELLLVDIQGEAPRQSLNDRELQCLQLTADGYKSDAVAAELGLSVHTVNAHLGSASDKLDAVNRIQAIAKALRMGFIG